MLFIQKVILCSREDNLPPGKLQRPGVIYLNGKMPTKCFLECHDRLNSPTTHGAGAVQLQPYHLALYDSVESVTPVKRSGLMTGQTAPLSPWATPTSCGGEIPAVAAASWREMTSPPVPWQSTSPSRPGASVQVCVSVQVL